MTFLCAEFTGLLVIDVQEKLFPAIDRCHQVANQIVKAIKGAEILGMPIVLSEQYPQGLGPTIPLIREALPADIEPFTKTRFSAIEAIGDMEIDSWLLVGIEAHVCVLQTAKEIVANGGEAVILTDAVSSRSIYDMSAGMAEAEYAGVRRSSVETVLFEMVNDADLPPFKQISQLLR